MIRMKARAGICAVVLTGACAATGAAAGGAQASEGSPQSWQESWEPWEPSSSPYGDTDHDHAAPAVVTARTEVYVRDAPTTHAKATATLPPGAHIRLFCETTGERTDGTSTWYFDNDAHGWISAAHVRPTAWQTASC
ncbi:hypothetical protein GTY65_00760 [Streptomyces sp. SID8379]|uniref:hypothetical protein n=1 Tax=unclassified Streptomyces TaxID=2593676 RepID=UPI00036CC856|nr:MULTISPECIES: hypothetical protein [unclassified Streptomyces]MYW62615.1 hypothetical protein [Streptomyces sp. SID8379]